MLCWDVVKDRAYGNKVLAQVQLSYHQSVIIQNVFPQTLNADKQIWSCPYGMPLPFWRIYAALLQQYSNTENFAFGLLWWYIGNLLIIVICGAKHIYKDILEIHFRQRPSVLLVAHLINVL